MNHLPLRDDAVEAWLTARRNEAGTAGLNPAWNTVDDLLTEYKDMADRGEVMTPEGWEKKEEWDGFLG